MVHRKKLLLFRGLRSPGAPNCSSKEGALYRLVTFLACIIYTHTHIYSATGKFVNPLEFSIFLHKYDPKHNQIFAQVLKVDKDNPIKQMRHKYFLSFIYSGN